MRGGVFPVVWLVDRKAERIDREDGIYPGNKERREDGDLLTNESGIEIVKSGG